MKNTDIISTAMSERSMSQSELAAKLGYARPSSINDMLRRKSGPRVDSFVKVMNALGYDVIVRDQFNSKCEWKVDAE